MNSLCNSHTNAMCRLATQIPQEGEEGVWHRCSDIGGCVPQADGKHFASARSSKQTRTEGEDATSITRRALWEDDDNPVGILC